MLSKIEPFNSFEDASAELLDEFVNRTQIADIILNKMSSFYYTMNDICTLCNTPGETLEKTIDNRIIATLTYFAELAPWFVLSYSELPWTHFFNNYMVIITKYQDVLKNEFEYEGADQLFAQLRPIMLLSEIGAGYEALISAGNMVVAELKLWKNVAPPSVTLSKAYMQSLGYYDNQNQD